MDAAVQTTSGWDHPLTAHFYEEFCRRHSRYQEANDALVEASRIRPGMRILDIGAGTGRTAESVLPFLGDGEVLCVEPATAMRSLGRRRIVDSRVRWVSDLPDSAGAFDRILWGAGIWQVEPIGRPFGQLARLLNPGGAICFNIPSLYLGIPDEPGGGPDPLLLELPTLLAPPEPPAESSWTSPPVTEEIDRLLSDSGLTPERTSHRIRIMQACLRDWLKIPVMTDRPFAGMNPNERARRIDDAFQRVDADSWKWEGWVIWAAWKPDRGI